MLRIRNSRTNGWVPNHVWDSIQKHQASVELPSVFEFNLTDDLSNDTVYRRSLAFTAIDPISKQPYTDFDPWLLAPDPLTQEIINGLSPGIRELVVMLNNNGFETTDSGDGSLFKEGMECACPVPMVSIRVTKYSLISEADRLTKLLKERGLVFTAPQTTEEAEKAASLEATYFPTTDVAMILLVNVLSKDVWL